MREHRNPRKRLAKQPSTDNPPSIDRRELSAAFRALVRQNPRAASAVLDVLQIVANSNRRRAMQLVEAVSMVVSSIRGRS